MNDLMHYGVKGMKWGVRRYQNKDGSLTNAGRKRLNGLNGYDIAKNSVAFRAVRNSSTKFMDRDFTYINVTDDFSKHSMATSEGFDGELGSSYKLRITKNLKIASSEEYFNAVMKSNGIDPDEYLKNVPNEVVLKGKYAIENRIVPYKLREGMYGNNESFNNTLKYLKKQGYDGVVDPIDGARQEKKGETPIAMVIFDPKEKLKITDEY